MSLLSLFPFNASFHMAHLLRVLAAVGAFGKYMALSIVNDGPVTITFDSPKPLINAQQHLKKSRQ